MASLAISPDVAIRPLTSGGSELVVDDAADYVLMNIEGPAEPTGRLAFKREGVSLKRHVWSLEAGRDFVLLRENRIVAHVRAGKDAHRVMSMEVA